MEFDHSLVPSSEIPWDERQQGIDDYEGKDFEHRAWEQNVSALLQ